MSVFIYSVEVDQSQMASSKMESLIVRKQVIKIDLLLHLPELIGKVRLLLLLYNRPVFVFLPFLIYIF